MPLEAHKRLRPANLLIKAYDLAHYARHRAVLAFKIFRLRTKKHLILGDHPDRLLVVRLGSLGDVVRATSVVRALRERYRGVHIDFLTSRAAAPLLQGNFHLDTVFTVDRLRQSGNVRLGHQLADSGSGLASFLTGSGLAWPEVLARLSTVPCRFHTGRWMEGDVDVRPHVDIWYCRTELEELFRVALLPYRHSEVEGARICRDADVTVRQKLGIDSARPYVGIFLVRGGVGTHDRGFRSYTVEYLGEARRASSVNVLALRLRSVGRADARGDARGIGCCYIAARTSSTSSTRPPWRSSFR